MPGVVAHGIGGVQDLPVPTWLFYWGAGVVLVLSFVALGALWKRAAARAARERSSGWGPVSRQRCSARSRVLVQALSVALFALVWTSALFGDTDPFDNLAPTWIYVVFWLGVPALSVLFGNVWRALSPWRAIADAFVWVRERGWGEARPLASYPERLGRVPGRARALRLRGARAHVLRSRRGRARLAFAIGLYTYVTLFGMAAFGRETWTRAWRGRSRSLFGLLRAHRAVPRAATAGFACAGRSPGLAGADRVPGCVAFFAVMLGSVVFDGYSRTTTWQDLLAASRSLLARSARSGRAPRHGLVNLRGAPCRGGARRARVPRGMRRGGVGGRRASARSSRSSCSRSCRSRSSTRWRTTSPCS